MVTSTYLIALGSNRRTRAGSPKATLALLLRAFGPSCECPFSRRHEGAKEVGKVLAHAGMHASRPIGSGKRCYVNTVALVESDLSPAKLLSTLKEIERAAGRRRGKRWGDRPLDLDIVAWSGGIWVSPALIIPHPEFHKRRFVMAPLCEIAADWRDPITHLTARQLLARLDRKRARA